MQTIAWEKVLPIGILTRDSHPECIMNYYKSSRKVNVISWDMLAGKDWGQEEKRVTEDEMVGWHHWLNGHEFEQTPGDSEGQGSLAYCSSWGHKESDMR